jgi:hypothetical protein
MVNKIHIHDEDNEVLKRFDHESKRRNFIKKKKKLIQKNKTNRPSVIIRTNNSFP